MSSNAYIRSLDGLRAIAILLVMSFHAELNHFGWTGVQLFFVLSGFLIGGILWKEKQNPAETLGFKFKKFWVRRSLRIFPLYFGYVLLFGISYLILEFPVYYKAYFPYLMTYTANYAFIPVWQHNPLFNHLWSLSIEEQFYLIFPLVMLLLPQKNIRVILVTVILAGPVIRYLLGVYFQSKGYPGPEIANRVNFHTLSHLDAFCFGALIPVFKLESRIKKTTPLVFAALALTLLICLLNYMTSGSPAPYLEDLGMNHWLTGNYQYIWMFTLVNICSALTILALVTKVGQSSTSSRIRKVLEHPWLVNIGKVSYGMYLFHWLIWVYFFSKLFKPEQYAMRWLLFLPYVLTVFIVASISYRMFEVHFIKLKDRFFGTPAPKSSRDTVTV